MVPARSNDGRVVLHIDMDAFFAQAEVLADPRLRGRPVVVGGIPGQRGVVATASYEARVFGIHSGMSLTEAQRRCPGAIFLPCHSKRYLDLSARILQMLLEITPIFEPASIDEAFLDARGIAADLERGAELARTIQSRTYERLNLTCSVGIGPNKLIAKMASALRKPSGRTAMDTAAFRAFFWPEPVGVLYGVGKASIPKLEAIGIRTVGELAVAPVSVLRTLFGVWGPLLGAAARGEDESPVIAYHATPRAKSLGHEYTLPHDEEDRTELHRLLLGLCDEVGSDMRAEGWVGDTVHLKIRWSDFTMVGRQVRLQEPTASTLRLVRTTRALFRQCDLDRPVRLMGVSVSGLVPATGIATRDLFDGENAETFESAIDTLRRLHGRGIVRRASMIREGRG
jgi:DNA polymerase IV